MDTQFKVNGQTIQAALSLPANGSGPGILLLHAWWGLNPYFKNLCEKLAAQGFVCLAPDLNNTEIATTVAEAQELMEQRDSQLSGDIVMAAKDFLLAHPACTSKKIGVIGFSMGAAWTLVAATYAPDQVSAAVLFYGVNETDFSQIKARVMGHFSDVDEWEPMEGIQMVEKGLKAGGVDVTFYLYPGLAHWFMEDNRPEYDPQAAELAWERTIPFLKENVC